MIGFQVQARDYKLRLGIQVQVSNRSCLINYPARPTAGRPRRRPSADRPAGPRPPGRYRYGLWLPIKRNETSLFNGRLRRLGPVQFKAPELRVTATHGTPRSAFRAFAANLSKRGAFFTSRITTFLFAQGLVRDSNSMLVIALSFFSMFTPFRQVLSFLDFRFSSCSCS